MARRAVLLADAEVREQVLEAVAAAGEARRVHGPLSVSVAAGQPCASPAAVNVATTSSPATRRNGRAAEQVAGVVVEPADDLDLAAVGEAPVGEVGLPDLVGRRGLEPDPGAARPLARLGHDEARGVEDPPDGRGRRGRPALALEVPGDLTGPRPGPVGRSSSVRSAMIRARTSSGAARARPRPAGPRLEGVDAALAVAGGGGGASAGG